MDFEKYRDHQSAITAKQLEDWDFVDESRPFLMPEKIPAFLIARSQRNLQAIGPYVNIGSTILDMGCGTGIFLFFLQQAGFKNLYGIEIHKESAEIAQKRGLDVVCGDIHEMFYGDGFFDAINCTQVFDHAHDSVGAINEIKRVLSPWGVLWIDIPLEGKQSYDEEFNHAGHHSFWGHPSEFESFLTASGFKTLYNTIYLYPPDTNGKVWAQGAGFLCQLKEGE